jgi:hypothetical protein
MQLLAVEILQKILLHFDWNIIPKREEEINVIMEGPRKVL